VPAKILGPRARGPAAILYLEDDPAWARLFLEHELETALPHREIVWVRSLTDASFAVERSPRFAAFLLDFRIGKQTIAPLLATIRACYPAPAPIHVHTHFGFDAGVARLIDRFDARLIEKRSRSDLHRFEEDSQREAHRILARRRMLVALAHGDTLTPRELQLAELCAAGLTRAQLCAAMGIADERYRDELLRSLLAKLRLGSIDDLLDALELPNDADRSQLRARR
jgi:DNA-binding CsgD family transcriptional regulator